MAFFHRIKSTKSSVYKRFLCQTQINPVSSILQSFVSSYHEVCSVPLYLILPPRNLSHDLHDDYFQIGCPGNCTKIICNILFCIISFLPDSQLCKWENHATCRDTKYGCQDFMATQESEGHSRQWSVFSQGCDLGD